MTDCFEFYKQACSEETNFYENDGKSGAESRGITGRREHRSALQKPPGPGGAGLQAEGEEVGRHVPERRATVNGASRGALEQARGRDLAGDQEVFGAEPAEEAAPVLPADSNRQRQKQHIQDAELQPAHDDRLDDAHQEPKRVVSVGESPKREIFGGNQANDEAQNPDEHKLREQPDFGVNGQLPVQSNELEKQLQSA